jgi:dynein heavy chain 2
VTGGNTGIPMGKNMPDIVAQIVWVRQILSKLDETCQTVTTLLGDLSGTNKFMEETLDFLEELKSSEKERVCLLIGI